MPVEQIFPTLLYQASLLAKGQKRLLRDLETACRSVSRDDEAGKAWSMAHGYRGYTSYASLADLPERIPAFQELLTALQPHVDSFAKALHFDLGGRQLACNSIWINVLHPDGVHTGHIHPHSIVSGTCYVTVPKGAGRLKLEDPRLGLMMAAPTRRGSAPRGMKPFVYLSPEPGGIVLFESWLRHEVEPNRSRQDRISISFNYA
jgi:uncharacterized protein (TIGR02466 family)